MAVRLISRGAEVTLELTGVVDVTEAAALRDAALGVVAVGPEACIVELQGVKGVDIAAVQVLLALQRALPGRVRFIGSPPAVTEIWRLAGLERLLNLGGSP
ncbi:MAG: STAS domain-containing protein [Armatimonadota bacterium]|nr:STAS domain-containing protein [Armatimonadota bacterium]MDR7553910.1 STAS domain-containing protein [Armatimonadota bacterium]MDR7574108.1 STAS domain-containing protein [Armatimonadota bacterium]